MQASHAQALVQQELERQQARTASRAAVEAYVKKHRLDKRLQDAVNEVVQIRPEEPMQALEGVLRCAHADGLSPRLLAPELLGLRRRCGALTALGCRSLALPVAVPQSPVSSKDWACSASCYRKSAHRHARRAGDPREPLR